MNLPAKTLIKNGAIVLASCSAIVFATIWVLNIGKLGGGRGQVWFYDLSERRLYAGSRNTLPPDRGVGGTAGDGVRAVVVGFKLGERDRDKLRIAYLETCSPELKAILDDMVASRASGKRYEGRMVSRTDGFYQSNDLVKRENDANWCPSNSEQAKIIMSEWRSWRGPNGEPPVICVP